jgi:putative phage-type endonuclease
MKVNRKTMNNSRRRISAAVWMVLLIALTCPRPSEELAIGRKRTKPRRSTISPQQKQATATIIVAKDEAPINDNDDDESALEVLWNMAGKTSQRKRQRGRAPIFREDTACIDPTTSTIPGILHKKKVQEPTIAKDEIESVVVIPVEQTIMADVRLVNGTQLLVDPSTLHQRHDEHVWLAVRSAMDVTASEFSSVVNNSIFSTREKLMSVKCGYTPAFTGNTKACQWGLKMEPRALRQYCQVTGHNVTETGLHILNPSSSSSPSSKLFGASPDGLVVDRNDGSLGLLEIKSLWGRRNKKELPQFDHCPNRFYDQIQGQLAVCDRDWCDLMVYIPPSGKSRKNYCILRIERNKEYWTNTLLPALETFCEELDETLKKNNTGLS